MGLRTLIAASLWCNPARTAGLALLAALLAFAVFAGAVASSSLERGLHSLQARLGADIIVAPDEAKSKVDLEGVLLDGVPGQFYMDASYVQRVAQRDGVAQASPQYFLATVKAGCCTMPVQIIGFDPASDFSIQPWVARAYASQMEPLDVATGAKVSGAVGSTIMFYGEQCRIVARLDETGTALDTAVFATNDTLQRLIAGSQQQGISVLADNDPSQVVSTVQVKVSDGYRVQDVADDINLHVRGVTAVPTRTMTSGVADGIAGASRVVAGLVAVLAVLAIAFLVVAFVLSARLRLREFGVLRMVGCSRGLLVRQLAGEAALEGALGAVVGIVAGLVALYAFGGLVEQALGLPFLLPGVLQTLGFAGLALLAAVLASVAASGAAASRLATADVSRVLREN